MNVADPAITAVIETDGARAVIWLARACLLDVRAGATAPPWLPAAPHAPVEPSACPVAPVRPDLELTDRTAVSARFTATDGTSMRYEVDPLRLLVTVRTKAGEPCVVLRGTEVRADDNGVCEICVTDGGADVIRGR